MNISEIIRATSQPYSSAIERKVQIRDWWFFFRMLDFNMQQQTQSNWCWAATSTSVSLFYWLLSGWTQCKVAAAELSLKCCDSPLPNGCNVPWYLDKALTRTHNLVSVMTGTVGFNQVKDEIDAGRVVCARIGWSGGGGHFVAIYGYSHMLFGAEYFDIDDPIYGKSSVTISDFTDSYHTTGSWTHTYFTQSYIRFMPIDPIALTEEVLFHIWEQRRLLGVKAGLPVEEIERAQGRSLGLAHAIFTLGLEDLLKTEGAAQPAQTGVRVMEFSGETPRALFDVDNAMSGKVRLMSAANPYLELLPRALAAATADLQESERRFQLRLLRVPALNFEALWLHLDGGDNAEDKIVPLRGFYGFAPMQPVSYHEALGRLREAAQQSARQDDTMGA